MVTARVGVEGILTAQKDCLREMESGALEVELAKGVRRHSAAQKESTWGVREQATLQGQGTATWQKQQRL